MKKFLLVIAVILGLLFIVDKTILKDKGTEGRGIQTLQYKKIENADALPVGLEAENKAPSFSLTDLDGNSVSLEDYKGKKVLLNFWATWCPPCKGEMPDMESLYRENKKKDFVVLSVNNTVSESSVENVQSFAEEYGLTFPILLDQKGEISEKFAVMSIPTTYFIDSDGVIRNKAIGAMSKEDMYKEMARLP